MGKLTLGHLDAEVRAEYYEETLRFPTWNANITLTPGRLDDDVGTFVMSVVLHSNTENRLLTYEERMNILDKVTDKLAEWKDDIKKRHLTKKLAGLEEK